MALEIVFYDKSIFAAIQSEKILGDLSLMKVGSWAWVSIPETLDIVDKKWKQEILHILATVRMCGEQTAGKCAWRERLSLAD